MNNGLLIESISEQAFLQLDQFKKQLVESMTVTDQWAKSLQNVKLNPSQLKQQFEIAKASEEKTKKVVSGYEKERLANIKLAKQREQSFDKFTRQINKEKSTREAQVNKEAALSQRLQSQRKKEEAAANRAAKSLERKTEKERLASLKLSKQREQAFDKHQRQINKEKSAREAQVNKEAEFRNRLSAQRKKEQAAAEKIIAQKAREAKATERLSTEYAKLVAKMNNAGNTVQNLTAKKAQGIALSKKEQRELRISTLQFKKYQAAVLKADTSIGRFQRNVGNYPKGLRAAAGAARSFASALGLVGGAFLFVQVMRDAIGIMRDFEKQNATLSAILQVEREDMSALREESIRLGSTTVKTAAEVTGLQIAYARLGFSQNEIIDLTEATISGSIAMNSELGATAELVGAVVNTFDDLSTSDAPKIIDILSLSTAKSALNFSKLETGIPIVAGAANAAGIPFTRLVALMGKLADSGIDVSTSSTAIRNIFIASASEGLNYAQIVEKIKGSQDKLTAANDEFGKRAAVSATVLAQNIDATLELDEALQGAAGTAERMANKELNTLDGAVKLLKSAWEGYIISIDDSNNASSIIKDTIQSLANNLSKIINTVITIGKVWVAYKAFVFLARIQQSIMNKELLLSRFAAVKSAQGVKIATISWKSFNKVLKANVIGIAVAALYLLYEVVSSLNVPLSELVEKTNESTEAFIESSFAMESHTDSMAKAANRYDELTSKTSLNKDEQKELDDIIKLLAKDFPKAVTEIDKYGKAVKLSTDEVRKANKENGLFGGQLESTLLKENQEQLKLLRERQEALNIVNKEGVGVYIEGVGRIANYNGVLKEQEIQGRKNADVIKEGNILTSEQQILFEKAVKQNEEDIKTKLRNIELLTAEGRARIKANDEKEAQAKIDAKLTADSDVLANGIKNELFNVSELREKIKTLNEEKLLLNSSQVQQRIDKDKLIATYQKEIDKILGVVKATRAAEKAILGTINSFKELISIEEKDRDSKAKTAEEYQTFQKRIEDLKFQLSLLNGEYQKLLDGLEKPIDEAEALDALKKTLKGVKDEILEISDIEEVDLDFIDDDEVERLLKLAEGYKEVNELVAQAFVNLGGELGIQEQTVRDLFDGIKNGFEDAGEAAQAFGALATDAVNGLAQAQNARIEQQIENLGRERDISLAFAGDSAEARAAIEERYQERVNALKEQQARNEQKAAIISTIINTATAIVKTFAQLGFTPFGIAAGATIAALGAAQVGVIASQPLPEFETGVRNFEGGVARINESRNEVVTTPDGQVMRPTGRNLLVDLPKGANVYTSEATFNAELDKNLNINGIDPIGAKNLASPVIVAGLQSSNGMDEAAMKRALIETLGSRPVMNLSINERGVRVMVHKQASKSRSLNNRVNRKGIEV